ncbi:YlzJ-like family protein [Pseudoneobacillus sp. C159]
MIHYTMLPQELIYPNDYSGLNNQLTLEYNGIPLLVGKTDTNEYQVIQILSTDPKHFLDSRCAPGAKISMIQ